MYMFSQTNTFLQALTKEACIHCGNGEFTKLHADFTLIVIHVKQKCARAVIESNTLDWVALSFAAVCSCFSGRLDCLLIHINADLHLVASWEPLRGHIIGVKELDTAHANGISILEPELYCFERRNCRNVLVSRPGKVNGRCRDVHYTPHWQSAQLCSWPSNQICKCILRQEVLQLWLLFFHKLFNFFLCFFRSLLSLP